MATTNLDKIILYGHPALDKSNNHNILAASLEYITKTQRFAMWFSLTPPPRGAAFSFLTFKF